MDYALINLCHKGDIVVSQDYGVAAMALGKGAYAIHQSGKWYTNENIDQMLMERHMAKKARMSKRQKTHLKGHPSVLRKMINVLRILSVVSWKKRSRNRQSVDRKAGWSE